MQISSKDLETSLKLIAKSISSYYPNSKIWFTKNFGKRREFITGAGKETFRHTEKLEYANDYTTFLQNLTSLTTKERNILTELFDIVTVIQL